MMSFERYLLATQGIGARPRFAGRVRSDAAWGFGVHAVRGAGKFG